MIPLFKPFMPDTIIDTVKEILYSGQLAYGKWGRLFEEKLKIYLKTDYLLIVNSYSSAINVAFSVLEINAGDEVIMSPMCCLQSTQPLAAKGIKIVWADVDPKTGTLDPESVKTKITSKTKAIFHNQHMGYVGYIDEINEIAKSHGIYCIDDCVDGMGGIYKDRKVGNTGSDATLISFHAVRLPNGLESGAITFKSEEHFEKAKITRDLGLNRTFFRDSKGEISENYDVTTQGFGAIPLEVNSFIAFQQMDILDDLFSKQRNNALNWENYIKDNLLPCSSLTLVSETNPTYWVFGMLTDKKSEMMDYFRNKGYYSSGVHLNNNRYSLFGNYLNLPGVNEFYRKFLAIPSGWWIKNKN